MIDCLPATIHRIIAGLKQAFFGMDIAFFAARLFDAMASEKIKTRAAGGANWRAPYVAGKRLVSFLNRHAVERRAHGLICYNIILSYI